MQLKAPALLAMIALLTLPGCVARTAVAVVTAPVRVASKAVDLATTSQSEADEKRGREIRRTEERLGKLQRSYDKNRRRCEEGDRSACDKARAEYNQIQELLPAVSYERR